MHWWTWCLIFHLIPGQCEYPLVRTTYIDRFFLINKKRYNYASGFFLFLVYVYLAMASLGLALESMITLLTPRFVPFFLFALVSLTVSLGSNLRGTWKLKTGFYFYYFAEKKIVFNVSPVVLPNDLQNTFYSYGRGFPVWYLRTFPFLPPMKDSLNTLITRNL